VHFPTVPLIACCTRSYWDRCVFIRRPKLTILSVDCSNHCLVCSRLSDQLLQTHDCCTCWTVSVTRRVGGSWPNEGAVDLRLERPACTALTGSPGHDWRHLYTVIQSLNVTQSATSSQCSSAWRRCLIPQSYFLMPLTTRAAAFMTRCNLSVTALLHPTNSRLQW